MVVSIKIGLVVLIQYERVTDRHPASHIAVASTAVASVAQVKKTKIRTFDLRLLGFFKTLKNLKFGLFEILRVLKTKKPRFLKPISTDLV